ncbi:MAG: 2Fe-2S iron-sulfur cluster-binding protein [Bacteroidota bacterium]|nr:MAG: 2Fe-2S iron-sulfur cluster binding domain-containing protein [Bacteroidota bacterium]
MGKITFYFEQKGLEPQTFEIEEGDTVQDIALDNDIELHHNCGGVCACSTCHVYVQKGMDNLREITDKEEDFIDRAVSPKLNSRLACQCELEEDGDIEVIIPDQTQFMGH